MKLPVWRQLPYISPSTFQKWESCQHQVYLSRLAGFKYQREPQGLAAAYGSAFDSIIKDVIAKAHGMKAPNLTREYLIKQTVDQEHLELAVPMGEQIVEWYQETELHGEFLTGTEEVRLDVELYGMHNAVPILGQLDLIQGDVPVDWKTGGFTSRKGRSPKKGWEQKFTKTIKTGEWKEYNSHDTCSIEKSNPAWAIQMCMYNWLLHNPERPYIIHEIVQHNDKISIAVHRGNISQEFNDQLESSIAAMWGNITGDMFFAHIQEPTPSAWTCHKYGTTCMVSEGCTFYQDTIGNPDSVDYA